MVMVLEQKIVEQIARIGFERKPAEACGLLLPQPINGVQVIELPNRSSTPQDSFEMHGEDMILALEMTLRRDVPEDLIPRLAAWHTHPNGGLGPSLVDMNNRPAVMRSLVVTLYDDRPAKATWF